MLLNNQGITEGKKNTQTNQNGNMMIQPEKQASNLTHTSGSLLEHSSGTETGGCYLCSLPLPCSKAPASPRREILHMSGAQIFGATAKGMHLNFLALETRGFVFLSHGIIIIDVTQKGAHAPLSGTQILVTSAREHLYIAWLWEPVGFILLDPTGLQPKEKEFLNSYHPQDTAKGNRPKSLVFFCEGSLLANHNDCGFRGRPLIKLSSKC